MNYIANVVGARPDACSPLALKIEALVAARVAAEQKRLALERDRIASERRIPDFNRNRHRLLVFERVRRAKQSEFRKSMDDIVQEVAYSHDQRASDLIGPCRHKVIILSRHEAIYRIANERPDLSYPKIGKYFSRDHTTILHAVNQHARRNKLPRVVARCLP